MNVKYNGKEKTMDINRIDRITLENTKIPIERAVDLLNSVMWYGARYSAPQIKQNLKAGNILYTDDAFYCRKKLLRNITLKL